VREIQLKDAKATFAAVVDEAVNGNGSIITRHGKVEAVVISLKEYERLSSAVPGLGWMLAHSPFEDNDFAERQPARVLKDDP
jgi:prevent-host-death family protein